MEAKMRRNFSGAFSAVRRGSQAWQLSRAAPHAAEVFLQGAEQGAEQAFGTAPIMDLGIEWRPEHALLSFKTSGRVATVEATSVIVHEPLTHLYASLPLAHMDADGKRFWRRVFRLVRIPGGRYLLGLFRP